VTHDQRRVRRIETVQHTLSTFLTGSWLGFYAGKGEWSMVGALVCCVAIGYTIGALVSHYWDGEKR
jgi:hypothetical protein